MKEEQSAGGVVYKKGQEEIFILVAQPTNYDTWVFPKGLIGDHIENESREETAVREVQEETGAKGKIVQPLTPVEYWYQRNGLKVYKKVYYFLMEYVSGDITVHDWEMQQVIWLPINKISEKLSFESDKIVFQEAKDILLEKEKLKSTE